MTVVARVWNSARRGLLWLLLMGSLGVLLQLFATEHGSGISPDSTRYIAAARNFLAGEGLRHYGSDGTLEPLVLWAPLYPLVLSIAGVLGSDPIDFARLLNSLLFGLNIVLGGVVILRHRPSAWLASLVGALILLVSPDLVYVHGWIWTEPLALFLGMLGLLLLDIHVRTDRHTFLVLSAILVGASTLTRYASLPFLLTGLLGTFLFSRAKKVPDRLKRSAIYAVFSIAPLAIWFLRNSSLTGLAVGRSTILRSVSIEEFEVVLEVGADWLLPGRVPSPAREWIAALFLVLWTIGAGLLLVRRARDRLSSSPLHGLSVVPYLLALFVLFYGAMLVVGKFVAVPDFPISDRILVLPYFAIVIGGMSHGAVLVPQIRESLVRVAGRRRNALTALLALTSMLLVTWFGFNVVHTYKWSVESHNEGNGYASISWEESGIIRFIEALPAETLIYTNGPDVVYILTGRAARLLPSGPGGEVIPGEPLTIPLAEMRDELAAREGVIVYFRGITWRQTMTEVELKRRFTLTALFGTEEGSIYSVTN